MGISDAFPLTYDEGGSIFTLQVGWIRILLTLIACYALQLLAKYLKRVVRNRELRRKILHRKAVNLSSKRRLKQSLAEDEEAVKKKDAIVSKSVGELLSDLKEGSLSAVLVLHAYQLKALEEDEKTNCVIEFIEEAERWAEYLDKTPLPKGPLHGLPVSIKDNIYVKGYDCTLGLVGYLDKPMDQDAIIVKILKEAGAIPFVKTNVPQTLLSYHCINPIFGATTHPLIRNRTPGGSSGGECALIAGGGSPLGIGSDIAGSGRIPAHFCGVYSLKPTANRISAKSTRESLEGCQGVYVSLTPIARDMATLVLAMQTLLVNRMFHLDPEVVPIPFNETLFFSKKLLRIGYYMDDNFATPTPGCQRAVAEAKAALERAGHELIQFTIPDPWNAFRLAVKLLMADASKSLLQRWQNDIVEDRLLLNYRVSSLPAACKKFLGAILKGVSTRGAIVVSETGSSGHELWKLMSSRKRYIAIFLSSWRELELDALLAPGFSMPAPPHRYPEKLLPNAFTTMLYNLLNFPVGVVPVTRESEQDQLNLDSYRKDDLVFRLAKQATHGALNMPVGVQIVGLPWQEELVLRVMTELDKLIRGSSNSEKVTENK